MADLEYVFTSAFARCDGDVAEKVRDVILRVEQYINEKEGERE